MADVNERVTSEAVGLECETGHTDVGLLGREGLRDVSMRYYCEYDSLMRSILALWCICACSRGCVC